MPWVPFVKTGYLGTNQWVPLVNGNGLTAGGGEPVPEIVWVKVTGTSPLSLPGAIANSIKSLTQYGLCTQSTTPTPDAPVDIMCNNGVLKYGVLGKNWFGLNESPAERTYLDSTGGTGTSANWTLSNFIAVNPATQYTFNPNSTSGATAKIGYYTAEQTFISAIDSGLQTFTTPNNCFFMRFSYRNESTNIQLEVGSTATAFEPYKGRGVIADGTPEVLTVSAISSIQSANIVDAKGLDSRTGVVVSNSDRCYARLGYYSAGVTIVQRATDNKLGSYLYRYSSDTPSTESFIGVESMSTAVEVDGWYERSATSTSDGYLFIQLLANKSTSLGVNWSATQPSQTVTNIPMLLSVGDYADAAEIISGGVTHRIGCHVFDGTETFSKSSAYGQAFLINAASASWRADRTASVLCTHFLGLPQTKSSQEDNTCFFNQTGHFYFRVTDNSDPDAFKAWLAAEYAAGHPVIVWFVLAEETTEQGTPHALHTSEGDNVVSVTANVSPVELECEYANGYE